METKKTLLDPDELLHLAIEASNKNNNEDAITYLKRALETSPENGKVHYMLGAMHAEIGLYDRAVEDMATALKYEPLLDTARFQLGLLHITAGRVAEAEEVWQGLNKLGKKNSLYLFKKGMLCLVNDEFEECISSLEKGIQLNKLNEALNNDMLKIIADAKKALGDTPQNALENGKPKEDKKHVMLASYNDDEFDKK